MSAERVIANLLRIAREDLEGARMLNARGNRNAIYLCEQAAEKIIRAVLTSEKVHAGVRHQLDEMVNLVPDENPYRSTYRRGGSDRQDYRSHADRGCRAVRRRSRRGRQT